MVVWTSYGQDGSGYGVFGQRFNGIGTPQGSEFRINTSTIGDQAGSEVVADAVGNFIVVWESMGQDGSLSGLFGRSFDATGTPQSGEFQVNSYTTNSQFGPSIALDDTGFTVAWTSTGQDGPSLGVFARRFEGLAPTGPDVRVNTYTTSNQFLPAVTTTAAGDLVVTWASNSQDGSNYGAFAQRYGDLIFRDDLQYWGVVPWPTRSLDGTG